MIKRILIAVVVLALIAATVFKLMANKEAMEHKAAQAAIKNELITVKVVRAEKQRFSRDITVNGKFEPVREVRVMSESQGKVLSLNVKEGSSVREGQTLATVESEALQNDLALVNESLAKAKQDLARYETLAAGGAAPAAQLDDLKLAVKNYESRIKSISLMLDKTRVTAPIGGVINALLIERGSALMPGAPVADIVDISRLELTVYLSEYELLTIKQGQQVAVTAAVLEGQQVNGSVTFIGVKADAAGKFPVKVQIPNSGRSLLRAGMEGSARFAAREQQEGMLIPRTAIYGSLEAPQVFVVTADSRLNLQPVAISGEYNGQVLVRSGLNTGDAIVDGGLDNLNHGMQVQTLAATAGL
ncbi:MAG: efflux RND transporter periplasmic adaptor subunit [Bacteroidia bacterium]|nr:efflux RND transporter periplasmic adaptor subunit [Bacteroidia bacterium]